LTFPGIPELVIVAIIGVGPLTAVIVAIYLARRAGANTLAADEVALLRELSGRMDDMDRRMGALENVLLEREVS